MNGIPDPGGSGVHAVLAAADAAIRLTEVSCYPQRHLLGPREAEVLDAADEALDVDDWGRDRWWER